MVVQEVVERAGLQELKLRYWHWLIHGVQILLVRRTLIELRENHVIPLRKLLRTDSKEYKIAQYKEQSKEFIFPNSSRIVLGYCANEGDVLQFQGQAYDAIFMEEATQFTEFQFQALTECNRSSGLCKQMFKPRMYFTANPRWRWTYVVQTFVHRQRISE